jgi:o-succinylbenzoate---CoA ligase
VSRVVALDVPWDQHFVEALDRVWSAGDAAAPLDPRLPAPAARDLLAVLRPTHLLRTLRGVGDLDGDLIALDGGLPAESGDALVVATSGSGASPKAVILDQPAVRASAEATSARLGVDPSLDRWLACIPLSHVGGLGVVTRAMQTGTPLVVHDRFDAAAVESEALHGATLVSVVATALRRIDPGLFRTVLLGGAAPPDGLAPNVITTYGMTETSGGIVYDGLPLDGVQISVGETGEVFVKGPMLLRAYRDGIDPKVDSGWLPTGDAGSIDEVGRLHVSGRIAETINTGGEKVWPVTVERVVARHPKVADVAVSGRPDPEWGERVVAFVVSTDPSDPPTLDQLRRFASEHLAPWAAPKEIVLLDALPRAASGKIIRRMLP